MKFKIIKSKFLEGLAAIEKLVIEASKEDYRYIVTEPESSKKVEESAAYRAGIVRDYNRAGNMVCPCCDGSVSDMRDMFGTGEYRCDDCGKRLPRELYEGKTFIIDEAGFAKFAAYQLGLKEFRHAEQGVYSLGRLYGLRTYFCVSPRSGFFNSHNANTLVFALDLSEVPCGWSSETCRAVSFGELFSEDCERGELLAVADVLADLKPRPEESATGKNHIIHERRDLWLAAIMQMLSCPYDPKDFKNGFLKPAAAMKWIRKAEPTFSMSTRTLIRDMEEFRHCEKGGKDKRESIIVLLLKTAADLKRMPKERLELAKRIADGLCALREQMKLNGGRPVELAKVGWAVGADGHSERVLISSEESIYDRVDTLFADAGGAA